AAHEHACLRHNHRVANFLEVVNYPADEEAPCVMVARRFCDGPIRVEAGAALPQCKPTSGAFGNAAPAHEV
ncbi:MAG: hypothetical protein Q9169_006813, partial [Polycauliona sp. 2 TL-2023]